jgi:ribosomal-protein-alanine N-acetyltransferase
MQLVFKPMTEQMAQAIACWQYEAPYSFYNMENDLEDLAEFLDPKNWVDMFYAVVDITGGLVGFVQIKRDGTTIELGLGLRPDLTGKGIGGTLLQTALDFAARRYAPKLFRLVVATFNERAIRVYTRAGFHPVDVAMRHTNGGEFAFVTMERPAAGE